MLWIGYLAVFVISLAIVIGIIFIAIMILQEIKYRYYKKSINYYMPIGLNYPSNLIIYFLKNKANYLAKYPSDFDDIIDIEYLHYLINKIKNKKLNKDDYPYINKIINSIIWV